MDYLERLKRGNWVRTTIEPYLDNNLNEIMKIFKTFATRVV